MASQWYIFIVAVTMLCCDQPADLSSSLNTTSDHSYEIVQPGNLLVLSDAEKILGESAYMIDSTSQHNDDVTTTHLAYRANAEDSHSKKTGVVYFLLEEYQDLAEAQKKYKFIKEANEAHGIEVRKDLGDEAYFYSDRENFYFIIVRKGKKVFNMKVNKITSTTSLDKFNLIAKKVLLLSKLCSIN